jgi:hypothetical protein
MMQRMNTMFETLEGRMLMAVHVVLNNSDSGAGSLRDAIAAAVDGDTVDLTGRSGTITLSGEIAVNESIAILGPGAGALTVTGNGVSRAFTVVGAGQTASFSDLTIANSGLANNWGGGILVWGANANLTRVRMTGNVASEFGGAVLIHAGNLNVTDSTFQDNRAIGQAQAGGAAISSWDGSLMVNGSTFEGNWSQAQGNGPGNPGIAYGGCIRVVGAVNATITNSTFFMNRADALSGLSGSAGHGAAFFTNSSGTLSIMNSTFAGNIAGAAGGPGVTRGGGIMIEGGGGTYTITNTIVAGNTAATAGADLYIAAPLVAQNNLIGDGDSSTITDGADGNIVGTTATPADPMLAALADNDGPTMTMALQAGSPAINAGTASGAPLADQRGVARNGNVDIGAYELAPANAAPAFSTTAPATAYFDTTYSYTIETTDTDGDALAITATGLPSWLTLTDHGDGTATLSGMPVDSLASSHAITLHVSDGDVVTDQPFVLGVPMEPFRMDQTGRLFLTGTVGRDVIQVWVRDANQVRAIVNGQLRNYARSTITGVSVYGLDENDSISVNMRSIPAYVLGGGGNDTITGADQADFFIGGSGHDRLNGAEGDDRLSGLGGNDLLEGGSGNDLLTGGDGHDALVGNAGRDFLYGDAGNDTLYAKDATYDIVYGGDGDDLAIYDANDLLDELLANPA